MTTPTERFVATFHTHAGALKFERRLKALGANCQLTPVPRKLSSSCGVCARFDYEAYEALACEDLDAVYRVSGADFQKIWENPLS